MACVALGAGNAVAGVEPRSRTARGTSWYRARAGDGPEGAAARARLTELCDAHDANGRPELHGGDGAGRAVGWIGSVLPSVRPGSVGILVQSGSFGEAWAGWVRGWGRGMVSSGNEGAGDAADWLAFYAADPKTQRSADAGGDPASGGVRARPAAGGGGGQAGRGVKVGTSAVGAERALAHSGAIAGSDAAFDALCRAYGVIRSADYGDWIEVLEVFGTGRRPRGPRLVVITNSGGEGEHAADLAERAGIPLQPLPATSPGARRGLGLPRRREPDRLLRGRRAGGDPAGVARAAAEHPGSTACC